MEGRHTEIDPKRPLVSVIMPAYNAEATLEASAESVLASSCRDIELLIIDDGSKDGTADICRRLAAEDARVWTVSVKNGGPAKARNLGLDTARGEFVTFVDSDDLISPQMLTSMLKDAVVNGADIAACGATIEYPSAPERNSRVGFAKSGLYEGESLKALFDLPRMTIFFSGWGKLIRRELIERDGLRFDTRYRITEDSDFAMRCLESAEAVYVEDECFYRYMQVNSASLTSVKNAEGLREAAFNISGRMTSLMQKWGVDEETAEREAADYLYTQLKAAAFIKLRSGAGAKEKRAFVKETLAVEGFKKWLSKGKFSSRALALGYLPAAVYTKLHGAYLRIKG